MLSVTIDLTDTRRLTAYPDGRIIAEQRADIGCPWTDAAPKAGDPIALLEARDLLRSIVNACRQPFSERLGL